MALPETTLNILLGEGRLIANPQTPDAALQLPSFVYGDSLAIRLKAWQRASYDESLLLAVDLSDYYVELDLGSPNERPALGFAAFTYAGETVNFNVESLNTDVLAAIGAEWLSVDGAQGDWIITAASTGARTAPTLEFEGNATVTPAVTVITAGTTDTPAQYRLLLKEDAPASIAPEAWTVNTTTPASTVTNPATAVYRVSLDPDATGGFFKLTVNGQATSQIPFNAGTLEIFAALATAGALCQVQRGSNGITIIGPASLTITDTLLVIDPSLSGILDLTGEGILELLDGQAFEQCELSVRICDAQTGTLVTQASTGIFVKMPVTRNVSVSPNLEEAASITLPNFATGLWHTVTLAGTNAAPTIAISVGAAFSSQTGPVFIKDEDEFGIWMLSIYPGALVISSVRGQGAAVNAYFNPRNVALVSPENSALFCQIIIVPPTQPATEPATVQIGTPA